MSSTENDLRHNFEEQEICKECLRAEWEQYLEGDRMVILIWKTIIFQVDGYSNFKRSMNRQRLLWSFQMWIYL